MSSNQSLNLTINDDNGGTRNIIQRIRQDRRRRRQNRTYQRRVQLINNKDTLNRILTLPIQVSNDSLINEFFNGSSFI